MRVLTVRNVNIAFPQAIRLILDEGVKRGSRNGPVLVMPGPVTTVYTHPCERVLFDPDRDCNPFFHLYESLWMLAGRNDLAPLVRYAKNIASYSDDGETVNGSAYGYRWRHHFEDDQLEQIIKMLSANPEDRRAVLQMWDASYDLGSASKDIPCNMMATFQRDHEGKLDVTVFCRSNDIIWGAYGANAVQFGTLLEYMACRIGCQVGVYRQVSVNWHAYLATLLPMAHKAHVTPEDPYAESVRNIPMSSTPPLDGRIAELLADADTGFIRPHAYSGDLFIETAYQVLRAHHIWKNRVAPERYTDALIALSFADASVDWVRAAREWIQRRQAKWEETRRA